jgi:hypothetical protein
MPQFIVETDDTEALRWCRSSRELFLDRPAEIGMYLWWRRGRAAPSLITVRPGDNGFLFVVGATRHDKPDCPQEIGWFMNFMGKNGKFQRIEHPFW